MSKDQKNQALKYSAEEEDAVVTFVCIFILLSLIIGYVIVVAK